MKAPWRLAIAIAVLATFVVAPAVSAGAIVPGRSIDGVRLLMSKRQVKHVLGAPDFVNHGKWTWRAHNRTPRHNEILVEFVHRKVYAVNAFWIPGRRAFDRTAEGVGLGSRMSAVDQAYPGHCLPSGTGDAPGCSWESDIGRSWFAASSRYGTGWSAPVETVGLQFRCSRFAFDRCLQYIRENGGLPPGF